MLYSLIVFFMTLAEVSTVIFGYAMDSKLIFSNAIVYGSPIYMITNLLNHNSAFAESNPIYYGLAAYHVIKYLCFFRSQITEDGNVIRNLAVIMEAAYLGLSAYYII